MIASKFYVTVNTTYGSVKGIRKFACYGDEYVSFQGIPYMKPPVGKLRFRVEYHLFSRQRTLDKRHFL
jgi:carboxylesterase type B